MPCHCPDTSLRARRRRSKSTKRGMSRRTSPWMPCIAVAKIEVSSHMEVYDIVNFNLRRLSIKKKCDPTTSYTTWPFLDADTTFFLQRSRCEIYRYIPRKSHINTHTPQIHTHSFIIILFINISRSRRNKQHANSITQYFWEAQRTTARTTHSPC
jgi:hypothetical protein